MFGNVGELSYVTRNPKLMCRHNDSVGPGKGLDLLRKHIICTEINIDKMRFDSCKFRRLNDNAACVGRNDCLASCQESKQEVQTDSTARHKVTAAITYKRAE